MSDRPLDGKLVVILVANGFDETEFTEPQRRMIQAGATVKVASRANGLVNGWYENSWGHFFPVDADLAETLAIDFDGCQRFQASVFAFGAGRRILKLVACI